MSLSPKRKLVRNNSPLNANNFQSPDSHDEEEDVFYQPHQPSGDSSPDSVEQDSADALSSSTKGPDLPTYLKQFNLTSWEEVGVCRTYANYLVAKLKPTYRGTKKARPDRK